MQCQQLLVLYLFNSSLDSKVVAWSMWDGCSDRDHFAGEEDQSPYATGLDALKDGWRLIQMSPLLPPVKGDEYTTSVFKYEFIFEKLRERNEE